MTKDWLKRPRCRLLGCVLDDHGHGCHNCGEWLYEDFITYGALDPILRLYWHIYRRITKRQMCKELGCCLPRGHAGEHDDIPF